MYQNQICDIVKSLWFLLQSIFLVPLQLYKIFLFCNIKNSLFCDVTKSFLWYHTKNRHFVISQNWFLISQYPVSVYHFDSLMPKNQFCDITNSISLIKKSFFISRNKIFFMWYKKSIYDITISNWWYHKIILMFFNTKKSKLWHHEFDLRYQKK